MILHILLAWSKWTRGWDELRSFYNLFSCFKIDTEDYVIFFCSQLLFEFLDKMMF